jgi:signal transduction histidine kinase
LFERAGDELMQAITELRELAHGIHPSGLRQFGLASAVQAAVARSSAPIEIIELPHSRVDDTAEATAFYTILESISNAQKHAQATWVGIRARVERGMLRVEVRDDGVGGATERAGLGLEGLRDRVEAVGGSLTLVSEPGRGTSVAAVIPVDAQLKGR